MCALCHDGAGVCGRRCAAVSYFGSARSDLGASFLMPAIPPWCLAGPIFMVVPVPLSARHCGFISGIFATRFANGRSANQVSSALSGALLIVVVVGRSLACIASKLKSGWRVGPITHSIKDIFMTLHRFKKIALLSALALPQSL